jgi:hypothetical protein
MDSHGLSGVGKGVYRLLANSVNRQQMLVIDGNNEDDRQTEDKFREVNDRTQRELLDLVQGH